MTTPRITIRRPDDWHVHLRDGAVLADVVGFTARQFARAIIMPNLAPPVTTTALAAAYRARIVTAAQAAGWRPGPAPRRPIPTGSNCKLLLSENDAFPHPPIFCRLYFRD